MGIKDRMPALLEMHREHLVLLRANASDAARDRNGGCSASVAGTLRLIGVGEFVVSGDVSVFRRNLSEVARIRLDLLERFSRGEPIAESYVAMLSYKELFDALAAGDFDTARRLARLMGGREEIERKHDHPFDYAMGYTLKAFVEGERDRMVEWAAKFSTVCARHRNQDFMGYAQVFNSVLSMSDAAAQSGLTAIANGHKKQSKRGGVFNGLEDEALCVWGVGMANLARHSGLRVHGVPPLIPDELLV